MKNFAEAEDKGALGMPPMHAPLVDRVSGTGGLTSKD